MSRTYRRKGKNKEYSNGWDSLEWRLTKWINCSVGFIKIDPKSKEGKRIIAKWYSDSGTNHHKEPGPMWFVREFNQVPYRMKCKNELAKWKKDNEYEVIMESIPPLDYWT